MFSVTYQTHHSSPFISAWLETFPACQEMLHPRLPVLAGRDGLQLPDPQIGLQNCCFSHEEANLHLAYNFFLLLWCHSHSACPLPNVILTMDAEVQLGGR